MHLQGSSAVGESGELMLPYPAPYVPSPSLPAPDDPNLPLDDHWRPQRRKAVLIACNYVQSPAISQLRGCINDMHCMREMLMVNFRFQPQDMLVLDDEQTDPEYVPTKVRLSGLSFHQQALRKRTGHALDQLVVLVALELHMMVNMMKSTGHDYVGRHMKLRGNQSNWLACTISCTLTWTCCL